MATITEILETDLVTNSRAVINTNFSNINSENLETQLLIRLLLLKHLTPTDISFSLAGKKLSQIPLWLLKDLPQVSSCFLENTQLISIPSGVFDDLVNISELNLNNNLLTTLPTNLFNNLSLITVLALDVNAIDATGINNVLASLIIAGVTECVVNLNDGTNAAPTGQGLLDKEILVGLNCTIITNIANFAITGVNQGTKTFTVAGDQTEHFPTTTSATVSASTGNNGVYTIVSSTFDVDHTDIVVSEVIPNATVDGLIGE